MTSGEAGIGGMAPEQARQVREEEQRISAGVVGVDVVEFRETWDGAVALNQADHIATGRAVLDAVRDAGNRWVFRELVDEGLQPWGGVRQVWAAGSPESRHGVDVTDTFDRGVASLKAHEAYLRGLGSGDFDPEEFLEGFARTAGTRLGCRYGASFEVFRFDLF